MSPEREQLEIRYLNASIDWLRLVLRRRAQIQEARADAPPARSSTRQPGEPVTEAQVLLAAVARAEAAQIQPRPALVEAAERLGLSDFERDTLLLGVAVEIVPSMASLVAEAQGSPALTRPTLALALSTFDRPTWDVVSPERGLRRWRLLEISRAGPEPLVCSPFRADERIVNQVKGLVHLDERLGPYLSATEPARELLPPSQQRIADLAARQWGDRPPGDPGGPRDRVVHLLGSATGSKRQVAAVAAAAAGLTLHQLDAGDLPAELAELDAVARLWSREAMLTPVALYLDADELPDPDRARVDRFLARSSGPRFLAVREPWPSTEPGTTILEVAPPLRWERLAAWTGALGPADAGTAGRLADQFVIDTGAIEAIAARARMADPAGAELPEAGSDSAPEGPRPVDPGVVWQAALVTGRPRMESLAQRVDVRATWDDLVLPEAELRIVRQIADQVAHRGTVYEQWGFADRLNRGLGINALFTGPSGTGKTMTAEVIAGALGLDLYRIDLSAVVSKYIGETEKNLRRLFDVADGCGAILFFDEADALFGKRSEVKDAHDRYANTEISYLLQRMEAYGGLAVLATNLRTALDTAFLRRLRFVVTFPYPDLEHRRELWRRALPARAPIDGVDLDRLAGLSTTGGMVQNIVLNAAFAAAAAGRPISTELLLRAARLEFDKVQTPYRAADFEVAGG